MKNKKIKGLKLVITIITIVIIFGIIIYLIPVMKNIATPEGQAEFKYRIQHSGLKGLILLFGLQIAQIFLFVLPGEPLEILAGMCYGEVGGTVFILVSVAITTAVIFFLVRKYGRKFIYEICDQEKIEKLENSKYFKNTKNLEYTLIILFMIPGTPKDLLVYLGGLLPIKPKRFILIATLARFPSIISSTLAGANMMKAKWITMILVYIIPLLIAIIVISIMKQVEKRKNTI